MIRERKGSLDPMTLAGLFITFMMFYALFKPLKMMVDGIVAEAGITSPTGVLVVLLIPMIVIMIIATTWDQGQA